MQSKWLSEAIKYTTTEQNKTWQNLKICCNDNHTNGIIKSSPQNQLHPTWSLLVISINRTSNIVCIVLQQESLVASVTWTVWIPALINFAFLKHLVKWICQKYNAWFLLENWKRLFPNQPLVIWQYTVF